MSSHPVNSLIFNKVVRIASDYQQVLRRQASNDWQTTRSTVITKYGHHIVVEDEYLADYPEDSRHYGPSGQVLDLDHLMIHGQEGSDTPFPCMYHGEGVPSEGVKPTEFCWDEIES